MGGIEMLVRSKLIFVLSFCMAATLNNVGPRLVADEPIPDSSKAKMTLTWRAPLSSLSTDASVNSLTLLMITDSDPLEAESDPRNEDAATAKPWCDSVFAKSMRALYEYRPDLRDSLQLQHMAAGTPEILTGGTRPKLPRRAMLVVLDDEHRLLGWSVGVPETEHLVRLIEDAEEVFLIVSRLRDDPGASGDEVARRSATRLDRRWANVMNEQWQLMGGRSASDVLETAEQLSNRISLLATAFRRAYVKDVALRFGLTEELDRTRLAILEQHPQTRRPWCEAMIPFLAGVDFELAWRPMIEAVWNLHCVSTMDQADDLIAWWDGLPDDKPVVLELRPPLLASNVAWPPPATEGVAARRGLGWDALHELLETETYRSVLACELGILMGHREIPPIDISDPSRARYLYFETTAKTPVLMRERDVPGRYVAFVKRNQD